MLRLTINHLAEEGQEEEEEIGSNSEMEGHLSSPQILYIYTMEVHSHTQKDGTSLPSHLPLTAESLPSQRLVTTQSPPGTAQSPPIHHPVTAKSPLSPLRVPYESPPSLC